MANYQLHKLLTDVLPIFPLMKVNFPAFVTIHEEALEIKETWHTDGQIARMLKQAETGPAMAEAIHRTGGV